MSSDYGLLPVKDRILLHLLKYNNPKRDYNLPYELTRYGIAEAICANHDYVCVPLNQFLSDGIIQVRMGHIKNGKKRKRYFTLTDDGNKYVKKMLSKLSDQEITLVQPDGSLKDMRFSEIYFYLKYEEIGIGVTEQDIYRAIGKDKKLEMERFLKMKKERLINYSADAPMIQHFFGRKDELASLKNWIDDKKGNNIIFVYGMAGIGKTTLVTKLIEDYRTSQHIFWHNFHHLDTTRGILHKLSDFLCKLGYNQLEMYLSMHSKLDLFRISSIIRKNLGSVESLWVFDDFHKSNDEIREFLNYFRVILNSKSKTKILIVSREIVPFYDRKDVHLGGNIAEMELGGLDFTSSKQLLEERGIDTDRHSEIYDQTKGNPLFLEFCDSKDEIDKYLHDEIFSNFKEDERNILGILSIFRHPISEQVLNIYDDFDFEKLYCLSRNSLVKVDSNDRYFLHELIRQFYYKRLNRSKRKSYHFKAAQWFKDNRSSFDNIEAIYHYNECGKHKSAFSLIIKNYKSIFNNGYAGELLLNLDCFDEKNMEDEDWIQVLIIKGRANNINGDWHKALFYFSEAMDIASISGNRELEVKALYCMGQILEERNKFEDAMDNFRSCLEISKKIGYEHGIGISYRGIGRIHWRKSEHEEAISNLQRCLEIAEELKDKDLGASVYIDLGNVYDERYEIQMAIDCYNKSLDILRKHENEHEIIRAYNNLAVVYRHQEDFEQALKCYESSLSISKKMQDINMMGYVYAGISYCFARIEKSDEALENVKKAEDIALNIDNMNIMFDIYRAYAFNSVNEENLPEAIKYLQKSLEIVEGIGASYYQPEIYYEFGLIYKKMNNMKDSKEYFKLAYDLYDKLGLINDTITEKLTYC